MIKRTIQDIILTSLKTYPVVGILGSRQVGKTTLAKTIKKIAKPDAVYLDLELPSDINKLQDAELYLRQFEKSLVIIDEIQRMPSLYPLLRALVDKKRIAGRFLILGSASPELIRHSSESLAGRIIYHELFPLNYFETGTGQFKKLLLRGGYPNSYLAKNDDESYIWRESYIKTYLEMDIPQLEIRIPSMQLRRFWTMLAHSHGQLWNASKIAGSLGISAPTVRRYLDILESTFIVRQLQPYHTNTKKRLIKSPKVYIRDSGLNHALLRIKTFEELTGHPSIGSSWEGFIIEQLVALLPENSQYYFYRSNAGAEIDFLYFDKQNHPVPVEIKYSLSPVLSKGFWSAFEDLQCKRGYVIYPGSEMYPIGKNVTALPLAQLKIILKT
ncbi:MAG: ATP-binding protein [Syntrophaceae bacterium]|nr:ATP-binding protein [Syntrophaceae bacterium]